MAVVNVFADDTGTGTEGSSIGETSTKTASESATGTESTTVTVYKSGVWQYAYYDPFFAQGARDSANNANYVHPAMWLKNSPTQDWD